MIREGRLDTATQAQAVKQIERAASVVSNVGRQASDLSKWIAFVPDLAVSKAVPLGPLVSGAIHRIESKSPVAYEFDPALEHVCVRVFERDALSVALSHLLGAVCREALGAPVRVVVSPGPEEHTCDIVAVPESLGITATTAAHDDPSPLFELGGWGLSLVGAATVVSAHGGTVLTDKERLGVVRVRLRLVTEELT